MSKLPVIYKNNFLPNVTSVKTTFFDNTAFDTYLSGRILEKDSYLSHEAVVTLIEAHSMTPLASMTTYNQGYFRFLNLDPSLEYLILAKDRSNKSYNAVTLDRLKPLFYKYVDETYPDLSAKPVRQVIIYPEVVVNEKEPNKFLTTKIGFNTAGIIDSKRLSVWSSSQILFKTGTSGSTGTFDGVTSIGKTTSAPYLNFEKDFTLTFFINVLEQPASTKTGAYLLTNNGVLDTSSCSAVLTKDLRISFEKNGESLFTSTTVLSLDTWYEITIVREDDSRISLFVNGVKEVHYDLEGLIAFAKDGVVVGGSSVTSEKYSFFKGILNEIHIYSKAIYSRDFGISRQLSDLLLFNENLKFAILFEDGVTDIASGLPVLATGIEVSSLDYDSGSSSGLCNEDCNLYVKSSLLAVNSSDDFTLEFAIKPDESLVLNAITYPLVRIGDTRVYVDASNYLYAVDGENTVTCPHTALTYVSFNSVRISRKQGVVGIFINDILQVKVRDQSSFDELEFFFEDTEHSASFTGFLDSLKYYPRYVNYDFHTYIDDKADPYIYNKVSDYNFKSTNQETIGWQTATSNGTLNYVHDRCISPPQSIYKLNTAGLYVSAANLAMYREWTVEGWFCLGSTRSGANYTLFDGSDTGQNTGYGQYVAIDPTTFKLKFYSGSTTATTSARTYIATEMPPVTVGEWFHFAMEYNYTDKKLYFYINFERVMDVASDKGWNHKTATNFKIGYTDMSGSSNDFGFSGWIDDVKLYRGVAKYSTPLGTRVWHPWRSMKNLPDAVFLGEYLTPDRTLETTQVCSSWIDLYRTYHFNQSTAAKKPVINVDSESSVKDSLSFDGVDDYLELVSFNTIANRTSIWAYTVFKVDEINTEVAEKRTIASTYTYSLNIHGLLFDVSLGDGENVENNNKIVYTARGYATNSATYKAFKIISNATINPGVWNTLRILGKMSTREMYLYINGVEDSYLANAFYNNSNTYNGHSVNYCIGRNAMETTSYFKGHIAAYIVGSSGSLPAENNFKAMDSYFINLFNIPLPDEHPLKDVVVYIEDIENL